MIPSVAKSTMGMDTWRILFSFCFDTFKIQHQRYAMNIHESASLIPRLAARASKGSSGDLWQLCYWKPLSVETTGFQQGPSSYSSSQISIQRNHVWVYQYTILQIYIYIYCIYYNVYCPYIYNKYNIMSILYIHHFDSS